MKYKNKLKINIDEKKIEGFKDSPIMLRQTHDAKISNNKKKNIKHIVIIENNDYKYRHKYRHK